VRPLPTNIEFLFSHYAGMLIDAYGVLVDQSGVLPGAVELVSRLEVDERPWYILSNDASRLPETTAADYSALGLEVAPEHIINSGSLMAEWFEANHRVGASCVVLGPPDSERAVEAAGGVVRPVDDAGLFDVLVIGDESGFPFLETVDRVLSLLIQAFERGRPPRLLCPNPDLIYPAGPGTFGFTSGTIASIFENALERRYPGRRETSFARLGKPDPRMYEVAVDRAGTHNLVMLGDQLATDIAGAAAARLDSVLLLSGVSTREELAQSEIQPTYLMQGLQQS